MTKVLGLVRGLYSANLRVWLVMGLAFALIGSVACFGLAQSHLDGSVRYSVKISSSMSNETANFLIWTFDWWILSAMVILAVEVVKLFGKVVKYILDVRGNRSLWVD